MGLQNAAIGIGTGLVVGAAATGLNAFATHAIHNSDNPSGVILPTSTLFIWGVAGTLGGAIASKMGAGKYGAMAVGAGLGSAIGGIAGLVIGTRGDSAPKQGVKSAHSGPTLIFPAPGERIRVPDVLPIRLFP